MVEEVELPECPGEWSVCDSDCIKKCSENDEIAPCNPGEGLCPQDDGSGDGSDEIDESISERINALDSAIDDLANMGIGEGFEDGPVQNFNNLFKGLQQDFKNFNSRIEDSLNLSRGCLMILFILILIVVFKEDILKSNFMKSIKSLGK